MTFKKWLQREVKNRSNDYKRLLPELRLKDGTILSIQASENHMCYPKAYLENGDYYSVEVYTHGEKVKGLYGERHEASPYIYGYVDTGYMEEVCKLHGGIVAKITKDFTDCVYYNKSDKEKYLNIICALTNTLPTYKIGDLSRVLIIRVGADMYLIKCRFMYEREDGSIDIERIHKEIKESDFIEISWGDYNNVRGLKNISKRTEELIGFNNNVIFDIDEQLVTRIINHPDKYNCGHGKYI